MEYQKVKSVAKSVRTNGPDLDRTILKTAGIIADVVGGTLGPGGQPVLIERYEHGLPPMVTKDGVTVFQALGFDDPVAHCIMEAARDSSVRTASEAGDGTTTATILFASILRAVQEYCRANARVSKQRVVRHIEKVLTTHIEPTIGALSRKVKLDEPEGEKFLRAVAKMSANGDEALADAVMQCFELTGDEGNVTIVEQTGLPHYKVEQVNGFSVGMGYEDSCGKFAAAFVNDPGTQRVVLEKPVFLLYHGRLNEIQTVILLMEAVGSAWQKQGFNHNVIICATGFSETFLANLGANFSIDGSINIFPLLVPQSIQTNGQIEFLQDMQAITGATIFDPLTKPVETGILEDLGPGIEHFECSRFRSSLVGYADADAITIRVEELEQQLENPGSTYDAITLRERIAKLSGGIAKLYVVGASNGETKEKRDRAEDAVCAVRGAIKQGVLPGGCWTLLKLCNTMPNDEITTSVLRPAFMEPFIKLLENCGISTVDERKAVLEPILKGIVDGQPVVYDALEGKHVDAYAGGILDSTPAVLEAIRNSISIATLLGTLGGTIVFGRDLELERSEAKITSQFLRDANTEEANERP